MPSFFMAANTLSSNDGSSSLSVVVVVVVEAASLAVEVVLASSPPRNVINEERFNVLCDTKAAEVLVGDAKDRGGNLDPDPAAKLFVPADATITSAVSEAAAFECDKPMMECGSVVV